MYPSIFLGYACVSKSPVVIILPTPLLPKILYTVLLTLSLLLNTLTFGVFSIVNLLFKSSVSKYVFVIIEKWR